MATIIAKVLDFDGFELASSECETIKQAKEFCKYHLSDRWAAVVESTHANMRTHKAEVYKGGECVWDTFYKPGK